MKKVEGQSEVLICVYYSSSSSLVWPEKVISKGLCGSINACTKRTIYIQPDIHKGQFWANSRSAGGSIRKRS